MAWSIDYFPCPLCHGPSRITNSHTRLISHGYQRVRYRKCKDRACKRRFSTLQEFRWDGEGWFCKQTTTEVLRHGSVSCSGLEPASPTSISDPS